MSDQNFGAVSAQQLSVKHGATFDAGLEVKGAATIKGTITIGDTKVNEAQLKALLALIES